MDADVRAEAALLLAASQERIATLRRRTRILYWKMARDVTLAAVFLTLAVWTLVAIR